MSIPNPTVPFDTEHAQNICHEVGHAVVAISLGFVVEKIVATWVDGFMRWDDTPEPSDRQQAMISAGSYAACKLAGFDDPGDGFDYDFEKIAKAGFRDTWLSDGIYSDACDAIRANGGLVRALSEALCIHGQLDESEIAAICREHPPLAQRSDKEAA